MRDQQDIDRDLAAAFSDFLQTAGWQEVLVEIAGRIEQATAEMVDGIHDEKRYWSIVGEVAALRAIAHFPNDKIDELREKGAEVHG